MVFKIEVDMWMVYRMARSALTAISTIIVWLTDLFVDLIRLTLNWQVLFEIRVNEKLEYINYVGNKNVIMNT